MAILLYIIGLMDAAKLSQFISEAPKTPGVYTWRDEKGRALYIGKATNLKNRLSNYRKATDPRIKLMVEQADSLSWQELETDIEALILESQSIKKSRPRFNIVMRDDKQYFFVAITKEDFPQLLLTHQAANAKIKKPIKELIGPFTEGTPLKSTLRALRSLFPYCSCKTEHHIRCLNAHIGKCPGYCCLKQPATAKQKTEYARSIRSIRDILTGKRSTVIRTMEKEMKAAGQRHEFELAMGLQKKIERIKRVFENAQINAAQQRLAPRHHGALSQMETEFGLGVRPNRIEGYDIANIQGEHANGAMVAFVDGKAENAEYRLFNIYTVPGANDTAMLRETISRRFKHPEWNLPDVVIVDGGKGQLNAAKKALAETGYAIPVISLTKNDKHQGDHVFSSLDDRVRYLKDLPRQLADLIIHIDSEAHRFAIKQYRRRHEKSVLK